MTGSVAPGTSVCVKFFFEDSRFVSFDRENPGKSGCRTCGLPLRPSRLVMTRIILDNLG